jgi:23S rRNA (pseudouridine1915-N3)-methyltransferase
MKAVIVAVGNRLPGWANEAYAEYAKRMPRRLPLELVEIRPEPRISGKTASQLMEAERERIERQIPTGARRVALDERGRDFTTLALARWLDAQQQDGRDLAFLIGGPDGLAPELKEGADMLLRLSTFTLPHALARVVLAEQMYRALSVLDGHPYHRE